MKICPLMSKAGCYVDCLERGCAFALDNGECLIKLSLKKYVDKH